MTESSISKAKNGSYAACVEFNAPKQSPTSPAYASTTPSAPNAAATWISDHLLLFLLFLAIAASVGIYVLLELCRTRCCMVRSSTNAPPLLPPIGTAVHCLKIVCNAHIRGRVCTRFEGLAAFPLWSKGRHQCRFCQTRPRLIWVLDVIWADSAAPHTCIYVLGRFLVFLHPPS